MRYIEVNNLNYYYPRSNIKALENINFSVDRGEIIFLAGESGSGKSTLAKCISGTVPNFYGGKVSGEILIDNKNINIISHSQRSKDITMVFQDPERQLLMNKVHREVAFGLENVAFNENKIKRRVFEVLQFVNILDLANRDINTLSGGEKQKVAIASAVAYLPKCIILDEPTSQLDPAAVEEIIYLIKKINEELGITIIIIEQRIDKWIDIADRIIIMKKGTIIFNGGKKELYTKEDQYVESFLPTYLKAIKMLGVKDVPLDFKEARSKISNLSLKETLVDYDYNNYKRENRVAIEIRNLQCSYEKFQALKKVDLKVEEGDFLSILGANGAGKSTLLKAIMGFIKFKGNINIFSEDSKKLKIKEISKFVGYVSQNPNDYISRDTVYDELKFTLDNHDINDYSVIDDILHKLKIYHIKDKNPRDISGGERQRLAIASILVMKPKILILDEPTRGLDYNIKNSLGKILKKLNLNGTTIIMVTHDVEFASTYCNKFALMFNGEVVSYGDAVEVLSEGIYYTTEINKLFRYKEFNIFNLNNFENFK